MSQSPHKKKMTVCKKCNAKMLETVSGFCKACNLEITIKRDIEMKFAKIQFRKIIIDFADNKELLVEIVRKAEARCINVQQMILNCLLAFNFPKKFKI